jgi:hypothetical protein
MDTANSLTLQVNNALNVGSNVVMDDVASNVIEVSGNVKTDSLFLGNFEVVASQGLSHVTAVSAATNDTVYLNNTTTGLVVGSNVEVGGNLSVDSNVEVGGNLSVEGDLTMNTITVQTLFTLDHVVSQGNTTSNTVQFTNPTTALTATGNVEVGGELSVSGDVEMSSNLTVSGNVGIGVANPDYKLHVSGGVSYFPDGISTPGYHAQWTLSGGGNVSWDGSNLLWSYRIIAIPVEKNEFSSVGFIEMDCPTSGTITYYKSDGTTGTATCTSSGVPIGSWEALWYVVTPGQTQYSVQTNFILTHYDNSNWRHNSNWLLIAVKNGDAASQYGLKFMPTNSMHYTWISPTFTDNWQTYPGGTWNDAGYYKDSENRVHLRGAVSDGTVGNGAEIFILPAGFRPAKRELFVVITNQLLGRVDISTDGRVIPHTTNNAWVSLDNLSFKAV